MDVGTVAAGIDEDLRAAGDAARAERERRYLKSDLHHYGVRVPTIRHIAKAVITENGTVRRRELVRFVETLWATGIHDARMAAVELLDLRSELLDARDLQLAERLIRESNTWALVDGLAAGVAGSLVERFPELGLTLDRWVAADDFWLRRASLLALLVPLRRGEGDFERFTRYADTMVDEREFFVPKAIGWVLREAGRSRPERVHEWLAPRAWRASGVTVREAVKYLAADQRNAILALHRAGRTPAVA